MENKMNEIITMSALLAEGIEKGIKTLLDIPKERKKEILKRYIKEDGKERGTYNNEVSFASCQLRTISSILSFKKLYDEKEHIKTLCDEIRTIADDLEKLI